MSVNCQTFIRSDRWTTTLHELRNSDRDPLRIKLR